MDGTKTVEQKFFRRLDNNELIKEHLPNQGHEFTKESVEADLKKYRQFLQSDLFKEICKMWRELADTQTLSDELLKHFGRDNICNWASELRQMAEIFLEQREWSSVAEIDEELFARFFEDMLVDIMLLKIFHEISHANKIKQTAYAASWWLRRKPFRFNKPHNKISLWANELFALTLLLNILPKTRTTQMTEAARHLLYHLKYRNINPQTLELFLIGLNAQEL